MQGTPIRLSRSTAALLTTMLAVSGLPSLSASGPNNPEISDAAGDASPSAFFVNTPENAAAFENLSAYDLVKVYVLLETASDLVVQFQVQDLPDHWGVPPELPADEGLNATGTGPNATQPAVLLAANFTVRGVAYEAHANLSQPTGSGVRDSYAISRAGSPAVAVSGSYDVQADTVTIALRKELLGSPRFGDVLSHFRAEGRFGSARLDFAPDAVNYAPGSPTDPNLVAIVLNKLTGQQVVQPRYGANYTFNYRMGSGDIELTTPEASKSASPGSVVSFPLQVKNRGAAADTVYFTLSDAAAGFQHRLSATELNLAVGETKALQVTVSTSKASRGLAITIVEARSRLGDTTTLILETKMVEGAGPAGGGTTGSSDPAGSAGPVGQEDVSEETGFTPTRKRGKSPGLELLAGLAAVGAVALVVLLRRRP